MAARGRRASGQGNPLNARPRAARATMASSIGGVAPSPFTSSAPGRPPRGRGPRRWQQGCARRGRRHSGSRSARRPSRHGFQTELDLGVTGGEAGSAHRCYGAGAEGNAPGAASRGGVAGAVRHVVERRARRRGCPWDLVDEHRPCDAAPPLGDVTCIAKTATMRRRSAVAVGSFDMAAWSAIRGPGLQEFVGAAAVASRNRAQSHSGCD